MSPRSATPHEPLAIVVYRALKDAIITCRLEPGKVITERELAEAHSVSKTPIRESLNRLREEGLVQTLPHKGTIISPITIQDIQDSFFLRLLLEPEAASLASQRATVAELKHIRELFERMSATSATRQRAQQLRHNTEFHLAVARASGNAKLAASMHTLLNDVERFYNAHHARGGPRPTTHWDRLVQALEERDAVAARSITTEGIRASRQRLMEGMMDEPG